MMVCSSWVEWLRDESGAAAVEYAIVVAFVAAAIALAVSQFSLVGAYQAVTALVISLVP